MVRKNFKMASWSLVLSIVTLLALVASFLIANTSFGKDLNIFSNAELKSDLEKAYVEIEKLINEKEFIMFQLKDQLEKFKKLEQENESLKTELEIKHQQIEELILKIDSLEKDVAKLMNLKTELAKAKKEYELKLVETKKTNNKSNIDTSIETKKDSLLQVNLQKKEEKESPIKDIIKNEDDNIRLLNSRVQTFHKKKSGIKKTDTNVAKVNTLELEYTLYVDKNANLRTNVFYIQIFDTNNKNVGKTKSIFINENELVYSFISRVEYEDEVNQIKEEFSTEGLNLDKGVYFLNIFSANGKLLSSRSFKLD